MTNGQIKKSSTEFIIKTDNNVGHEMGWKELGAVMTKINTAIINSSSNNIADLFKIKKKVKKDARSSEYYEISLPNKEMIMEADTAGYLVLIAEDKTNIIMPKYFNFMMDKLKDVPTKGTCKTHLVNNPINTFQTDDSKLRSSARNLELLWPKLFTESHAIVTATAKTRIKTRSNKICL